MGSEPWSNLDIILQVSDLQNSCCIRYISLIEGGCKSNCSENTNPWGDIGIHNIIVAVAVAPKRGSFVTKKAMVLDAKTEYEQISKYKQLT